VSPSSDAALRYGNRGGRWAPADLPAKPPVAPVAAATHGTVADHLAGLHNWPPAVVGEYSTDDLMVMHDAEHRLLVHPTVEVLGHTHDAKISPAVDEHLQELMARAASHATGNNDGRAA
jgi:hypothetical protein